MLRKSAISLAVIGALGATQANALGLGEVRVSSALNQPLQAEIDLLQLRGLNASQIITSLADTDDFYIAGVKPTAILSDLRFKLDVQGNSGKIILSTSDPIREPFLNFLIEVNWPSGRLVREYTVLLDPPVFSASDLAPRNQPVAPSSSAPQTTSTAPAPTAPRTTVSAPAAMIAADSGRYQVKNDDTLWQIALQTRPDSSVSPQQMMLAIQRANPDAFVNGNINRLKSGVVLDIPSKDQILNFDQQESMQEVKRQNSSWKGAPASTAAKPETEAAKLDASDSQMTPSAETEQEDSQLRIVSKDSNESMTDAGQSSTVASETAEAASEEDQQLAAELAAKNEELEEQLVVTLEGLDKVERDNAEMFDRMDKLTEQMESLQRLLELKDQQLAELQGQLAQKQSQPAGTEPAAEQPAASESLPMALIGGIGAAVLALLAGLFALFRKRKQDQEVEEALVVLNERDLDESAAQAVDSEESGVAETAEPAAAAAAVDEFDSVELDEIEAEEDPNDPFNLASEESGDDELATISDAELDSALGDDLDMDLKLDEPIEEDPEMAEFSNSLLNDDEYDLSTGLDETDDEVAEVAETDGALDGDLDALLAETEEAVVPETEGAAEAEPAVEDALEDDFSTDLDDLLAEDGGADDLLDEIDDSDSAIEDMLGEHADPVDDAGLEAVELAGDEADEIPDDDTLDALLSAADGADDAQELEVAETTEVELAVDDVEIDEDIDVDLEHLDELEAVTEPTEAGIPDPDETEVDSLSIDELPEQTLDVEEQADTDELEFKLDDEQDSSDDDLAALLDDGDSAAEVSEGGEELDSDLDALLAETEESADDAATAADDLDALLAEESSSDTAEEIADAGDELSLELDDATDDGLDFAVESSEATPQPAATEDAGEDSALSLDTELDQAEDAELEAELEQMLESEDNALSLDETDLEGDEIDYLDEADEVGTKLDLARAYIDMDDIDGARDILNEVISEGSEEQAADAKQLLESLKG